MTTHCQTIQLLEPDPFPDLEVTDPSADLATEEGGALALTIGVTEYTVLFGTTKLAADYDFIESDIENETDGDPLSIVPTMTNRTTTQFTLQLDSEPDTANYVFRWKVRLTEV